jgi:sialidase-1
MTALPFFRCRWRLIAVLACLLDPAIAVEPPATAYAHYMAGAGVTKDSSGVITLWANQAGVTGRDLDRIIGTPKTALYLHSSTGGTADVVLLDGASALWAAATNWGSMTGDRCVVARVRLKGTANGFLFDGSTTAGKTRAQINTGNWQLGVQSTAAGWTSTDLVTTAMAANTWQTHIFEFDDGVGSTTVRHFIDGINVGGGGNVALTTALGGLILGANGGATGKLNAEVAEILVYNRLLSVAEKSDVTSYMQDKWGDLIDIPPASLTFVSATTVQSDRDVSRIGIHGMAALAITSAGNTSTPGYALAGIDFNLTGTTDLSDIVEIQVYSSPSGTVFDAGNATLLDSLSPSSGTLSATFNSPIAALSSYFWIAAKMKNTSTMGDFLDASITSFHLVGEAAGSRFPTITSPPEKLTINNLMYRTVLHARDQYGVGYYRIPGLVTTNANTLIASFDLRYGGSAPDLPADIDIGIRRSTDGGVTWSPVQVIMDYDKNVANSQGNGVADPCLLVDKVTGRIWCAGLWSFGNRGWSGSGPGLTPAETGQFVLNYSDDDGITWTAPVSITSQIKNPAWRLYFQGPGKGICLRDGTLVFPSQFKDAANVAYSNFIYSKDRGVTWNNAPPANPSGSPHTNESQIVELDNGNLLISMKNFNTNHQRLWCVYSWNHATQTIDQGSWGTPWYSQNDPTVEGSVHRYRSVRDGHAYSALLFANPDSSTREKMSIRVSLDEGLTWPYKRQIDARPAAYSCMTILPDGDIGLFYETGDLGSIEDLLFMRFPIEWITGTTDTDLDGLPDFYEDATGLNKADPADASLDSDGDGQTNLFEYQAHTDPFDANSNFRVRTIERRTATNRLTLKWPAIPYAIYQLESSQTLTSGSWQTVPGLEAITNSSTLGDLTMDVPIGENLQNFYRISTVNPP